MGGLEAALDRFAAIEGCLVAVEKELLADRSNHLPRTPRRRADRRLGHQRASARSRDWLAPPIRQITTDRPDIALEMRRRG